MKKLESATEEHGFNQVWSYDGRIMIKEEGDTKLKVYYPPLKK